VNYRRCAVTSDLFQNARVVILFITLILPHCFCAEIKLVLKDFVYHCQTLNAIFYCNVGTVRSLWWNSGFNFNFETQGFTGIYL